MADAKQLEADVVQESLLARACRRRDLFQVQALLRDKADPNERSAAGETPLLEAANGGDVNVVALLLGHGADVATRARPGFEADAERGLQQHIKVLFYIFRERGKSAVDRRAALERLPVALDPGALAHVYVKLGLGGRQCGGVRQGGMAPAEALVRRTPLREAESAADHDIVLHLADPLRPVLVANPLWQKPTATVVLLHGMLQSGQMMERMIRDLARTLLHVRFLAPTAPTLPTHGGIGPAWWNVLDRVPEGTPPRHWRQSTAELEDILEMEKENGMMPDRIVLAGFSLGGAMAISLALKAQQQFGGLVVMGSARVPSIWKASPNAAEGLPVLQVHGEDDHMATLDDALKSADFLRGAGCNVHFSTYSHVGHTVSAKMLEEIRSWLMECLPPDGPRKKVMHTSAADTKMEHTGAAETKMEQTGAAELEVHIEVAETKTEFAADQRLEEEEPEAAEAEAGHTPEKLETCEIGQMHEDESLLNSRSTDTEAVDEDVSALHAKSEADTKSAAEVELPSSPPEPPLTDLAAAGLGQVDEEPDGISAPEKSVRIREDALALLLAYDIPLRACEEVLPRFDYDGDAALDFLMDSEEGQQFVLEIEKAGETEVFDTTTLPEGVPAFDISTPPDADNTDTMEMEGYDDEIDWGTLQYGADMPKAKRQTASSSTSSMDFWEDVVPEGTGDFSERQDHPVGEKGPNTPPLLEVETGSFEAQGQDTEATREQLGGVGITLEVDEASTPCISTLEAETSRHQPDVASSTFNFDEESSPRTSRQASGEQAEAFVNTLEPDLVADSAPKSSRGDVEITEQPGAIQSALGVESVSDTSGQEQSRAAGVSRPAAESSPSASAQEREASTEPRGVSSTSRVATEFSSAPRSDSQDMETGRDQGEARSESDFGVDTSASAQAENGRQPPETVNAVELDAESASVQQTQTDREGQEADRARSDSAHEPETCREQSAGTCAYEFGADRARSDSEHQPETCREQSAGTCAYEFGADRARSDSEHQPETCREQSAGTGAHTARSDSVDQAEACREQPADSLELGTESTPSTSGQESETSRSPLGPASSIFEFGAESTPSTSGQESEQPGVVGSTAEVAARGAPGASAKEADARAEQSEKGSTSDICADNHKLALLLAFNLPLEACRIALRRFDNDEDSALEFLVDTKEGQTLCAEALQAEAAGAPAAHATFTAGAEPAAADRAGSDATRAAPANSPSAEDPVDNGCKLAEADSVDCQPKVNGADDSTPFLDESSNGTAPVDSTAPASGPPAADAAADKSTSAEADAIGCQAKGERQASEHDPEVGAKSQGPVVPQPSREKPLALAIKRGNLLKVKKLLKRGEDANMRGSKGETPLFAAVRAGHATIVATLLLGKADPSIRSSSSAKAADLATKTEIRCLLELASGRKVGAREQRSAFAALSDCTPLLFQRFLKARGMQVAVSNVRSEHEWDLACLSVSAAVAA